MRVGDREHSKVSGGGGWGGKRGSEAPEARVFRKSWEGPDLTVKDIIKKMFPEGGSEQRVSDDRVAKSRHWEGPLLEKQFLECGGS